MKKETKMPAYNVLSTMTVDGNTAAVVDGSGELFHNGISVQDENGKSYEVISVGTGSAIKGDALLDKTSLLIKGKFESKRILLQ